MKRRSTALTALIVLTLALGIGASTLVFAILKAVLLNPLPYKDPDRLVAIVETDSRTPNPETVSSIAVSAWMRQARVFERLSVWEDFGLRPVRGGVAEELRGMRVSTDYFETLGIHVAYGRTFRPSDGAGSGASVVILTDGAWHGLFGGAASIIGRPIATSLGPFTVVGILPPGFRPMHMSNPAEMPQVFTPLADQVLSRATTARTLRAVGRLTSGITSTQAQTALNALMRSVIAEHREYPDDTRVLVTPLRTGIVGNFASALWMLQLSVLALFALACANGATMLLARSIGRRREFAIRSALGATRATLVRQVLFEHATLAASAAIGGVALAWIGTWVIRQTGSATIPRLAEIAPDLSTALFATLAASATFLCGVAPAAVLVRRVPTRDAGQRILRVLAGTEVALAFAIVLVVALLSNSYLRLTRVNPGYDPHRVLTLSLLPDGIRYRTPADRVRYFDAVADRMRAIDGVEDAAYASTLPLGGTSRAPLFIRERPVDRDSDAPMLDTYLVSTNYVDVMRIPVIAGRGFTAPDGASTEPVALVSASAARMQFGGNALGRHVQIGSVDERRPWAVIVGVVGDVHQYGLDRAPDAAVYVPVAQVVRPSQGWTRLVVRARADPARVESSVRAAMMSVDPLQPVFHLQPMSTYIELSLAPETFALTLVTAFGLLALVLATGGVYGVLSYAVRCRTREFGVRMAVGAAPRALRVMVLRDVATLTFAGMMTGYLVAALFTRGVSGLLYGITRFDPMSALLVAAILLITSLLAAAAPAERAARVDPATALRDE